ncbi:MAG: CHAT domain-containing protein [Spirochaetia bacterium]
MQADMVELSACETGLGKVVQGDGVLGLTRAFMVAGANGVGATLWVVDDLATKEFMVRVYGLATVEKLPGLIKNRTEDWQGEHPGQPLTISVSEQIAVASTTEVLTQMTSASGPLWGIRKTPYWTSDKSAKEKPQ